ncbi:alpha/beta hydrolase [Paractinoplanes deccanensis]|uniref:Alpha/beta hydrolase n=1 Tax=Paractinoplanes deccanensis TaxID=113561 RepID=A0ABQ3Y338_9ACTN|nr:alpha/beta hydrolase [Actinoplanes deccanensis]GID74408.1 alpha/beta hydrolase [Actinoplanes deccanensis]
MSDKLSYEVRGGSGPGLVLVHGTSSTGLGTWGTVVDGLAAGHRVVLPDLPGSGSSPLPAGPLDLDAVADQVVAAADDAGLGTFRVAGASLGAPVAVRIAARHPERVEKLVSVVGFAHARPTLRLNLELWAAMYARREPELGKLVVMLSFAEEFLAALSEEQIAQYTAMMSAHPAPGTSAQIELGLRLDVRGDLAEVRTPALVVAAAGDRFVPPAHSRELAAGIPGARLAEVPGGHAALFEDPRPTLAALLDFLGD